MANIVSTSKSLVLEVVFVDGDTRTLNFKNPRSDISANEISSLSNYMKTTNIILGDKYAADFWKIRKAKVRQSTTTILDIDG